MFEIYQSQPYLIAEIGVNHDGYLEKAIELIKKAHLCGGHAKLITDIAKA